MLPQVANHIFHHTTRAVAAAPAVRNVLGSGAPAPSWAGAGSSYGAGAGAGHAGAGGSKYHAGSRFYSGYTGPGRAVTQANTTSSNGVEIDEEEAHPSLPKSRRKKFRRSASFSLGSGPHGEKARAQDLGVLKAVQAQVRSRHAFATPARPLLRAAEEVERPATPRLVRRNSTASTLSVPPSPSLAPEAQSRAPSPLQLSPTDPRSPQTVEPPVLAPEPLLTETERLISNARGDPVQIRSAIDRLRRDDTRSVVAEWNAAIKALASILDPKISVAEVVALYHDMLGRNYRPDMATYECLLLALLNRASAVHISMRGIRRGMERRALLGETHASHERNFTDNQALAALEAEKNYPSALAIFRTCNRVSGWAFTPAMYTALFRACAEHGDIESALQVYAHMEARQIRPQAGQLRWLMQAYTDCKDYEGAAVVFSELERLRASAPLSQPFSRIDVIDSWNEMIRNDILSGKSTEALGLLEKMIDTANGITFGPRDVPCPSPATYDTIIDAFTEAEDYATAVTWYERLHSQERANYPRGAQRRSPSFALPLPLPVSAEKIIAGLARHGKIEELNQFGANVTHTWNSLITAYYANVGQLLANPIGPHVAERLDWLHSNMISTRQTLVLASRDFPSPFVAYLPAISLYSANGRYAAAAKLLSDLLLSSLTKDPSPRTAWESAMPCINAVLFNANGESNPVPLRPLLDLVLPTPLQAGIPDVLIDALAPAFDAEVKKEDISWISEFGWRFVAFALWRQVEAGTVPIASIKALLKGVADAGAQVTDVMSSLARTLAANEGYAVTQEFLSTLGPTFEAFLPPAPSETATPEISSRESILSQQEIPSTPNTVISTKSDRVDNHVTQSLNRLLERPVTGKKMDQDVEQAWRVFSFHSKAGVYPSPEVLGSLIQHLGRQKNLRRMYEAYDGAQVLIESYPEDAQRLQAWGTIEGNMIVGLAHAGDGHRADTHRQRMLEQGLTPNADAYAALIQAVRDTTDDTSIAMTYFDEAMARGVTPNLFLFNTAISKLSKARKADLALQLFGRMKQLNIRSTPVTYGAVIGACCRVGDIASAETLFEEMLATQTHKKLRVPPFNTMMQFFVQTKPNRERVMQYYQRLRRMGIMPSAHTYKLVLDAYGSIEPVDFTQMEETFQTLCKDPHVQVEDVHWASLINAYGCVGKDLDKAISTFESIPNYAVPSVKSPPKSAVVFEALINVFVTHRRLDLVPPYIERLRQSGVHMTAYISNLLIRGYALTGDIETARQVFESMCDPPAGVAAPNNHAPHDANHSNAVPADAPVYREPSTWEVMVRAELGQGNRKEAVALLERLAARHYPESIYKRISGIMLDDSVSPWPANLSADEA